MQRTEQELKNLVAQNMAIFRKKCGLTQSELAEKLSYSDKSVSKWERGEGIPDFYVLTKMADIFGVNVGDFLLKDGNKAKSVKEEIAPLSRRSKLVITALAVGLVWLFATVLYFVLSIVGLSAFYLGLVYYCAIPVSAIVTTIFTMLWFPKLYSGISVAVLIWSVAFGAFFYIPIVAMKYVFAIAAALQVLEILWYVYLWFRSRDRKKQKNNN